MTLSFTTDSVERFLLLLKYTLVMALMTSKWSCSWILNNNSSRGRNFLSTISLALLAGIEDRWILSLAVCRIAKPRLTISLSRPWRLKTSSRKYFVIPYRGARDVNSTIKAATSALVFHLMRDVPRYMVRYFIGNFIKLTRFNLIILHQICNEIIWFFVTSFVYFEIFIDV